VSHSTSSPPSNSEVAFRPRRDFSALTRRRLRAAELFAEGQRPAQVAEQLQVSVQSASLWHHRWLKEGVEGLTGAGRAGRLPRLSAEQIQAVESALLAGPREHGFRNELWTLSRVAEVISRLTGVSYHPGHVWRILRRLGWTRQKPSRWAAERDPEKVEAWVKERWPELKRGPSKAAPGSSSRTKAASR
jgi:transposase